MEREARAEAGTLLVRLGAAIRDARVKAGLSQTEVGKLTRKGQPYQSKIEGGNANMTSRRCCSWLQRWDLRFV